MPISRLLPKGLSGGICCALLLFAACSNEPPSWASLVSSRIRNQYPDTKIEVLSAHTLKATLDGRSLMVDLDDIGLQCNRGPRDCDHALDQVLLELHGTIPPSMQPSVQPSVPK